MSTLSIRSRVLSACRSVLDTGAVPTVPTLVGMLPGVNRNLIAAYRREILSGACSGTLDGQYRGLSGATPAERAEIAERTAVIRAEKARRGEKPHSSRWSVPVCRPSRELMEMVEEGRMSA